MTRSIILFTVILCLALGMNAQNTIPLTITDPVVTQGDEEIQGNNTTVTLQSRRWSPVAAIVTSGNVLVEARYKVRAYQSRTSQAKDSGIQIRIKYTCYFKGKKRKKKVTRVFFLNDDRQFTESQTFLYDTGLYNTKIDLTYKGSLPK